MHSELRRAKRVALRLRAAAQMVEFGPRGVRPRVDAAAQAFVVVKIEAHRERVLAGVGEVRREVVVGRAYHRPNGRDQHRRADERGAKRGRLAARMARQSGERRQQLAGRVAFRVNDHTKERLADAGGERDVCAVTQKDAIRMNSAVDVVEGGGEWADREGEAAGGAGVVHNNRATRLHAVNSQLFVLAVCARHAHEFA